MLVIGAGLMARAVAYDLVRQKDVERVTVCDRDSRRLSGLRRWLRSGRMRTARADAADRGAMRRLMQPCDVAVSCIPYFHNLALTRLAIATRTHFCDLGGNNAVVRRQLDLTREARRAGITVIPDCGLAPGMVSILAADGFSRLDRTDAVHLRVGGLPRRPKPPFNYTLLFSANGLINEYVEPCLVLSNGRVRTVPPMTDVEEIVFPPPFGKLEAFNTSGGTSTLPYTFLGKVKTMEDKTIRYPGHCAGFKALLDLGLADLKPLKVNGRRVVPRHVLIRALEKTLGFEPDDVTLVRVEVEGRRAGRARTIRYQLVDYADRRAGLTSMMRTTGFPAAIVALMLGRGRIAAKGVLPGEKAVPSGRFLAELAARGLRVQRRA
jgi:lysine 6-dehydrogenase